MSNKTNLIHDEGKSDRLLPGLCSRVMSLAIDVEARRNAMAEMADSLFGARPSDTDPGTDGDTVAACDFDELQSMLTRLEEAVRDLDVQLFRFRAL
jgi:hypothetical protein